MLSDKELLKQWKKHKGASDSGLSLQYKRAKENHAFHAGNEMSYSATVMDKGRKKTVVFNKVKPFIDSVCGFMIQLRRKPDYAARVADSELQQYHSEYMDSLSNWVRETGNFDSVETRQDREMLIVGVGATDSNIVYEKDPNGLVVKENLRFDDLGYDPMAIEPNLLDSRWVYRRKIYSKDEAEKRFKGVNPEEFEAYNPDSNDNFVYYPEGGLYDKISSGNNSGTPESDLVEVYQYQWWNLETYYRAKNPIYEIEDQGTVTMLADLLRALKATREELEGEEFIDVAFDYDPIAEYLIMTPDIKNDVKLLLQRLGIPFETQEYLRKVYYTAIITNEEVLRKFKSPDQQGFTIKFKTGAYDPIKKLWFGMVDALKEPARYSNKALTEILYVIAANSKGGVMYEKSAVTDPTRFEQQYATTKAAIQVEDGAISGNKIAPKAQAALPNGYENIYQISDKALGEVTGINKEFLGNSDNKQVSALLEAQRINQVVSTLADYFDSISLYQIEDARINITYIKMLADNSNGRLISILGEDGFTKYEELSSDRLVSEYDVKIGELPVSASQRAETTTVMMTFADKLAMLGQNIYPFVVDYLPIKQADKQKLKQAIMPDPNQQQAQAQAAQEAAAMEKALNSSIIQATNAKAQRDTIEGQYKLASIPKIKSDISRASAETAKTLEDAQQRAIENDLAKHLPVTSLNVTI